MGRAEGTRLPPENAERPAAERGDHALKELPSRHLQLCISMGVGRAP